MIRMDYSTFRKKCFSEKSASTESRKAGHARKRGLLNSDF
jgi:hypothetical protein